MGSGPAAPLASKTRRLTTIDRQIARIAVAQRAL
jgi:hypothetical protein